MPVAIIYHEYFESVSPEDAHHMEPKPCRESLFAIVQQIEAEKVFNARVDVKAAYFRNLTWGQYRDELLAAEPGREFSHIIEPDKKMYQGYIETEMVETEGDE